MAATKLSEQLRITIFLRDGATCVYCGATHQAGARLEADHVVARSRGGSDLPTNLVTACRACNEDKAHLSVAIYVLHRAEQGLPVDGLVERVAAALARPLPSPAAVAAALALLKQ